MATTRKTNTPKKKSPRSDAQKPPAPKVAPTAPPASGKRPTMEKPSKKSALRDSILARKAATKPIALSLDEVRAIAKSVSAKAEAASKSTKSAAKPTAAHTIVPLEKPAKPNHIKAASLSDILGFNPKRTRAAEAIEERDDDAGDLSAYGQHMADAGTDTFDRDFALSLVSSEQDALSEIDAAIKRIRDGTYGICEITSKPISKERLLAVPFTRHSAEAQKQIERNRHHSRTQAGLLGEAGEEGSKIMDDDGGEE